MSAPAVTLALALGVDEAEVAEDIGAHDWYHRIGIGSLVTPGVARYQPYQRPVLAELARLGPGGQRVLDVGCRDGLVAFAAEQQGAAEVVGVDNNPSTGAAEVLVPASGSGVRFVEANVLDLAPGDVGGPFDLVVAAGLLYHLREPFRGLRRLAGLLGDGGRLILETAVWLGPDHFADLWCPTGRDGPYDATSPSFFNRRGLTDSLAAVGLVVERQTLLGDPVRHPPGRRARLLRRQRTVDRLTLVARHDPSLVDPTLDRYFHATHHTRHWT